MLLLMTLLKNFLLLLKLLLLIKSTFPSHNCSSFFDGVDPINDSDIEFDNASNPVNGFPQLSIVLSYI